MNSEEIFREAAIFDGDELFLSSSSDSSDDEAVVEVFCSFAKFMQKNNGYGSRVTIKNYVEEVVPSYTEPVFVSHFRVTRALYQFLVNSFRNSDVYQKLNIKGHSRLSISPEKHILTFLWFAGHQTASFRDVVDRFDLSLSSLFDVISRVMSFLIGIMPQVIKWPSEREREEIKHHYQMKSAFPNVIGCIDGSHIKIDRPQERAVDYFNRKDYHSIILQAVCDHNLKFLDVFIGYPGSVHDARVFRHSPLYNTLQELSRDDYLLGDSAYPLLENLITPYKDNGHLTRNKRRFNTAHSSCRISIEHAFGKVKQRFRQLYHLKLIGPRRICEFVTSCCVLHNLCNDDGLEFNEEEAIEDVQPEVIPCLDRARAAAFRDALCNRLFQ